MALVKRKPWLKRKFNHIKDCIKSTILCIRFPFLYPRNRFSDLHKHNYALSKYIGKLYSQATEVTTYQDENDKIHVKVEIKDRFKLILYYILNFIYHWPYQLFFCIPHFTELIAMPDGWRKAFGIQMCKEIRSALIFHFINKDSVKFVNAPFKYIKSYCKGIHLLFSYRILQIKDKWAELRWYDGNSTEAVHDIIYKYEGISRTICIGCGKPAKWYSKGWINPYCDDCIGNTSNATPMKNSKTPEIDECPY